MRRSICFFFSRLRHQQENPGALGLHSHPNPEKIPQMHLCDIVADVLIIHQIPIRIRLLIIPQPHTRIRNTHPLQTLMNSLPIHPPLRRRPAHSKRRIRTVLLRLLLRMRVPGRDLIHRLPELRFDEEQQTGPAAHGGLAVLGRFAGHVGEVDALAEGVAVDGGFGRGDTEALREDTAVIGGAGAVPEEAFVGFLEFGEFGFLKAIGFAGAVDAEDVFQSVFDPVTRAGGLDEVICQSSILGGIVIERGHFFHAEILEAFVEDADTFGIFFFVGAAGFHDCVCDFHVS